MAPGSIAAKDHRPLPEKDLISLCEAVTWLATGRAREARTIHRVKTCFVRERLIQQHAVKRDQLRGKDAQAASSLPQEAVRIALPLLDALEVASAEILSLIRREVLTAYGRTGDGGRERIPPDYFMSEVYGDYARDLFEADVLAWQRGEFAEELPVFRSVRFRRADLVAAVAPLVADRVGAEQRARRPTAAAEAKCVRWLVAQMLGGPPQARKDEYCDRALAEFGIDKRQFIRAWDVAKIESGTTTWGKPGRRRKC